MDEKESQIIADDTLYSKWLKLENKVKSYKNRSAFKVISRDYFWQNPERKSKNGYIKCILGNSSDYLLLVNLLNLPNDVLLFTSIKEIDTPEINIFLSSDLLNKENRKINWTNTNILPRCINFFEATSTLTGDRDITKAAKILIIATECSGIQLLELDYPPTGFRKFALMPILIVPSKIFGCKLDSDGIVTEFVELPYAKYTINYYSDVVKTDTKPVTINEIEINEKTVLLLSLDHYEEFMDQILRE